MWFPNFKTTQTVLTKDDDHKKMVGRPRLISLEGNIGAGKSTFIEHMKSVFQDDNSIVFLQEPVDIWESVSQDGMNMLQLFYDNPKKYAFAFQVLAFTTRLKLIKNAIADAMKPDSPVKTIVMERSLEADKHIFAKMLYDEGKIESCEYQVYQMMSKDGLSTCSADGIIWLTTCPNECRRRISTRGREGEEGIGLDYLNNCDIYHGEWLSADLGFVFRIDDPKFVGMVGDCLGDEEEEEYDEEEKKEQSPNVNEILDWEALSIFIHG